MKANRSVIFWIAFVAALISLVGSTIRVVSSPADEVTEVLLILGGSVFSIALLVLACAWSISARMRRARQQLPTAFVVPVVVGDSLASALSRVSAILGRRDIRIWSTTYATLAFDVECIHVFGGQRRQPGLIPIADLLWGGLGATLVGARQMDAIVFQFVSPAGTIELPIVPMKLRGNALRPLSSAQMNEAHGNDQRTSRNAIRNSVSVLREEFLTE